jgi:hypothetical protein
MKGNFLTTSAEANVNYLAQIVQISKLEPHTNANKLQLATVCGSVVITGLDAKVGDLYVYFPVECVISPKFLSWSNSYQDAELNKDKSVKGFFHKSSRVKMLKLRGLYSNGYIVPLYALRNFIWENYAQNMGDIPINTAFDTICGELFVWKYVVPIKEAQVQGQGKTKGNIKKFNRVIPEMFNFHPDTKNLRYEIGSELQPVDYVSVTKKYHGSNFLVANTLVYKKLNWLQKLLNQFGANISDREYGLVFSSRTVIKNKSLNPDSGDGWYGSGSDIWKVVAERAFPKLDKGIRISGEIIGYTPTGKMIQPKYDYGVPVNELDFLVFKVDVVNFDGETFTMSYPQMVEYCAKKGFRVPECYYYGMAKDLFPELNTEHHWHDNFLQKLEQTFLGKKEESCIDKTVPEEGICVSVQKPLGSKIFKLKDLEFLGYETQQLDSGDVGVTDEEIDPVETLGDNDH